MKVLIQEKATQFELLRVVTEDDSIEMELTVRREDRVALPERLVSYIRQLGYHADGARCRLKSQDTVADCSEALTGFESVFQFF